MHPSQALASVVVDELVRHGVTDVVLCPGSRSAPFAYAVQEADRHGRLRLHVRVDERSAGFLALGLAKGSGTPTPVITTSGTAVANLHPAVLEAHHANVPLLVISCDRPPELRGTGANQTTVQPGLFAGALRYEVDLGAPEADVAAPPASAASPASETTSGAASRAANAYWRSTVSRAVAASRGVPAATPGPAHLNVPLRDPLAPVLETLDDSEDAWATGAFAGRPDGRPWVAVAPPDLPVADEPRTVVVVGDLATPGAAAQVVRLAELQGWPCLAEPYGAPDRALVVPHGPLLLSTPWWSDPANLPERVLVVGRVTLSRAVARLLAAVDRVEVVTETPQWADPGKRASRAWGLAALRALETTERSAPDRAWTERWRAAGRVLDDAVRSNADHESPHQTTGLAVATTLLEHPAVTHLFVGSSNAIRDVDLAMSPRSHAEVIASRGLAGIDGCVSTAVGLALAVGRPLHALVGDLTFLHDANGLLIGPGEPVPDLTIVVVNDDGGGIFSTLEYGEPSRATQFERVFGTPTGTSIGQVCAAHGVRHEVAATAADLEGALAEPPHGLRVVEVPVDRTRHRAVRDELVDLATRALQRLDLQRVDQRDA